MMKQTVITLAQAALAGLFDSEHDFIERDWKGRAAERPNDPLYVYSANYQIGSAVVTVLGGFVDGEEATYSSLLEFQEGVDQVMAQIWTEYLFDAETHCIDVEINQAFASACVATALIAA